MNKNEKMKILILFSGTGSIERGIDNIMRNNDIKIDYRGLDIDPKWNHHYTLDILTWDYKEELKNWTPDYIHSSFVCAEFSSLKNGKNRVRDLKFGFSLINKTIEIFEYIKKLNPDIIITCENPRNKFARNNKHMLKLNRITTFYCKYGFKYMKPTDFFSNIELNFRVCNKNNPCDYRQKYGYHMVCLGFDHKKKYQMSDSKYFSSMRKDGLIKRGFNNTYLRYRIPQPLVYDMLEQIIDIYLKIGKKSNNDLIIIDLELSDFIDISIGISEPRNLLNIRELEDISINF